MFSAGFGWVRLALDGVVFGGFGGFLLCVLNDFRGWLRGGGRNFLGSGRRGDGGIDLLGDVGGGVKVDGGPIEGIEAAELFELAVAGGDGAFGGGDFEAEAGEAASGTGGGLVGAGHGEGPGAGGESFVLALDFDGLEFVFEQDEADAAEALGFPLAGGEAVDDLFHGWLRIHGRAAF